MMICSSQVTIHVLNKCVMLAFGYNPCFLCVCFEEVNLSGLVGADTEANGVAALASRSVGRKL